MRYYALTIQNSAGQVLQVEKSGLGFTWDVTNQGATFSSVYTPWQTANPQLIGQPNPAALNLEFNIPLAPLHTPQGGALIRVWGLGIRCLSQAADLNPVDNVFKTFVLRAGMSKGLPLANPAQAGIVAQGLVYQSFGEWSGTEQVLNMIILSGSDASNNGVPISWNWPKGENLTTALTQMFAQAFPSYTATINVSANLVAPSDQKGIYRNIDAFAKYLHAYTKKLGAQTHGSGYQGVGIIPNGTSIYALDGAGPTPPKTVALAFQDLVGQPCWIAANTITFSMTLRGDINYGDRVTFPKGVLPPYALTAPSAAYPGSPAASASSFAGTFLCNRDFHLYANFRQPDAAAWNSTYTATLPGAP